jgi:hypothetical protein
MAAIKQGLQSNVRGDATTRSSWHDGPSNTINFNASPGNPSFPERTIKASTQSE